MDVNKIHSIIAGIEASLAELKTEVARNPTISVRVNAPTTVRVAGHEVSYAPPAPAPFFDPVTLIDSPAWPEAVPADLICDVDSEEDKVARAAAILDMTIMTNLRDVRFLDYGCGEGHMAVEALARGAALSVGFDPMKPGFRHPRTDRLRLTNQSEDLEPHGYDVILLYDVLDHCKYPTEVLYHVARLLAPGGTVYAVCHPWVSRCGGHLYRKFNKAYAHLWLDTDDIAARGLAGEYVLPVTHPAKTYRQWFKTTEFKVKSEEIGLSDFPIERFFTDDPVVWSRLTRAYDRDVPRPSDEEIRKMLEIEFVSYTLQAETVL